MESTGGGMVMAILLLWVIAFFVHVWILRWMLRLNEIAGTLKRIERGITKEGGEGRPWREGMRDV